MITEELEEKLRLKIIDVNNEIKKQYNGLEVLEWEYLSLFMAQYLKETGCYIDPNDVLEASKTFTIKGHYMGEFKEQSIIEDLTSLMLLKRILKR